MCQRTTAAAAMSACTCDVAIWLMVVAFSMMLNMINYKTMKIVTTITCRIERNLFSIFIPSSRRPGCENIFSCDKRSHYNPSSTTNHLRRKILIECLTGDSPWTMPVSSSVNRDTRNNKKKKPLLLCRSTQRKKIPVKQKHL